MERIKNNKLSMISSSIITLIPLFIGMIIWNQLPEQLAIHFDMYGNPDNYCSKGMAVYGINLLIIVMHLVFTAMMSYQKEEKVPNKMLNCCTWIFPAVSLFCCYAIYGKALSLNIDIAFASILFIGITTLIIGNYMPKVRQNKLSGVRVKWTLESARNWAHTNRFSGYVMCACGILLIILSLVKYFFDVAPIYAIIGIALNVLAMIIAPVVYSYLYYKKHNTEGDYYNK